MQHDLAGRGERLGAFCLDMAMFLVPVAALGIIAAVVIPKAAADKSDMGMMVGIGVLALLPLLALGIYNIYLLSVQGQTLGKKLVKVKIVKFEDGSNGGFVTNFVLRAFVNGLIGLVPFYGLVDILFIFTDENRCLHDRLAGTVVVRA